MTNHPLILSLTVFLGLFVAGTEPAVADSAPHTFESIGDGVPMENFSPLEGVWRVTSHSVRERMSNERIWLRNTMETEYRILLGGLVAINDTYGTFNDNPMHGIMIRAYDPDLDEWQFHWMSKGYPHLTEQVRGRFENGIGVFHGKEGYRGKTYDMRFRWKLLSSDHAFWEQSYRNPDTGEWEANWTLELRRKD